MARVISFRVGPIAYPIGRPDLLGSFFDTIAVRLEAGERGRSYPLLARLYANGELAPDVADAAIAELRTAVSALRAYAPGEVVWDAEDPRQGPPWGDAIASSILTLADYHVTSDGRRLHEVLDTALNASSKVRLGLRIA